MTLHGDSQKYTDWVEGNYVIIKQLRYLSSQIFLQKCKEVGAEIGSQRESVWW
jgi:hypothetical protein